VAFLQNHDQTGNRGFGERLSHLISPERLALARAGLLLSPQVPMLYMGEEWSASTPFLFFVDFSDDEALSTAVREGRRREFAKFTSFSEGGGKQVPDPTDEDTFRRSILQWDEVSRSPHAETRSEVQGLLKLRRDEVVPLLKSAFLGASRASPPDCLDVTWRFETGTLRFVANFGGDAADFEAGDGARLMWASPAAEHAGARLRLQPWTGAFLKT
jgi:maltooligosyltrehalose trehalohydrolase